MMPNINLSTKPPLLPFWLHKVPDIQYLIQQPKSQLLSAEISNEFLAYQYNHSGYVFLYTDGSCLNGQVGCAVTGRDVRLTYRLPDTASVFTAELFAIHRALKHINEAKLGFTVICSDSKSALEAIKRPNAIDHPLVYDILRQTFTLPRSQVVIFLWLPGHCSIRGNELADAAAKEATSRPCITEIPIAVSDVLAKLKQCFTLYVQRKWDRFHSNHLYDIKPILSSWSTSDQNNRSDEVVLCRLRCGHTRATHSHLFDREPPPMCQTCNVRITVHHFLLECPNETSQRRKILDYLRKHKLSPSMRNVLGNDHPELIELVLDFAHTSKWTDRI